MKNEEKDLGPCTKQFARRIMRLYIALSKDTAVAIFVTISKSSRGN
jgi:hypothetical protein